MSTDWWSAGQRWLEQQALREADAQRRSWVKSGRSVKTFRYTPPDWHRDAVEALGRNDEETFKAIRLAHLGTTGLPPLVRAQRSHAAKKSPAQLQREIDEVLASPGAFSYEEAMDALEKRHAGVPRGGSLRAGHAPVVPEMSPWRTRVFNSHAAAVGFLNRIKKRHVAVIEEHGTSQWRVAYLPEGEGMPLNE